jgi:hypothetical protein
LHVPSSRCLPERQDVPGDEFTAIRRSAGEHGRDQGRSINADIWRP